MRDQSVVSVQHGVMLIPLATGVLGITFLEAGGLVSGSILSVLGLALLYKSASRKEAKEHLQSICPGVLPFLFYYKKSFNIGC